MKNAHRHRRVSFPPSGEKLSKEQHEQERFDQLYAQATVLSDADEIHYRVDTTPGPTPS
ncbi:MAG: hypothetical protein WCK64_09865 [Synechococcaceae cyanobacterium ELA445]